MEMDAKATQIGQCGNPIINFLIETLIEFLL